MRLAYNCLYSFISRILKNVEANYTLIHPGLFVVYHEEINVCFRFQNARVKVTQSISFFV